MLRPVLPPPSQPFSSTATLRDAVLLGEVIGGREPVAAAADDDRVVARLRRGLAPRERPGSWPLSALAASEKIE